MSNRMKAAAGVALVGLALTACTQTADSADDGSSKASTAKTGIKIGVVTHGATGDQFWSDVKQGVEDAGAQTGSEVDYQSSADPDEQGRFIAAEVSKKVDALVVSIPSLDALSAPIKAAEDAGVPVIVINSGANDWQDLGAAGFVGQDET